MILPEHFEQCTVVCLLWVVDYLNSLCVVPPEGKMQTKTVDQYLHQHSESGDVRMHLHSQAVVAGPFLLSSREPYSSLKYPRGAAELRLGEPKSAQSESCDFSVLADSISGAV